MGAPLWGTIVGALRAATGVLPTCCFGTFAMSANESSGTTAEADSRAVLGMHDLEIVELDLFERCRRLRFRKTLPTTA